ncbi:MFS transporter [Anaerotignum sp. MB30-C6]|uniref:MFS transporter n=1 Tax=Anaerotignum sp. MB30-C6 TaxID=3070814 RepID=UPI0027DB715A|nr:MFS transporter [Anaerotignum sp. MB30-C6]WMI79915.1 MFS transporter [Anaerotignum sp. MB30-C6]
MRKITLKQGEKIYYGWWQVLVGFLLMSFAYVSFISVTSVFVLPVTTEFACERSEFMLHATILCLISVVAAAFMGKKMAKGNIKLIMIINALIAGLGFFGFSRATSLGQLYAFAAVLGIPFTCLTTMPISILLNNWFGGKMKGTAMGLAFLGSGVGGMILTPVLNYVNTTFGWRVGYLTLAAIFVFFLAPVILFLVVKTPAEKGQRRMGETASEASSPEAKGMSIGDAKKSPMMWLVSLAIFIAVVGSSGILANSVAFFVESGFSAALAASVAGLMLGSLTVGKPLVGMVCDKFGVQKGSILSFATFSLCFFSLFLMSQYKMLVILVIVFYAFGCAAVTICPPLLTSYLFGEKDYGAIIGIFTMATNIGGAFGGTVAAKIFDMTGSYASFWLVSGFGIAVAVILCLISFKIRSKYDY